MTLDQCKYLKLNLEVYYLLPGEQRTLTSNDVWEFGVISEYLEILESPQLD